MISEPSRTSSSNLQMNSSNSTTNNTNQNTQIKFSFTTPIKLDRSNYLLWCSPVLASIKGNQLENFINGRKSALQNHLFLAGVDGSTQEIDNLEF